MTLRPGAAIMALHAWAPKIVIGDVLQKFYGGKLDLPRPLRQRTTHSHMYNSTILEAILRLTCKLCFKPHGAQTRSRKANNLAYAGIADVQCST